MADGQKTGRNQRGIDAVIENLRLQFEASRDPLFLWAAYRTCRDEGIVIPEWVLVEFDETYDRLAVAYARRDLQFKADVLSQRGINLPLDERPWKTAIADAFGFRTSTTGGRTDAFRQMAKFHRDYSLAADVYQLVLDGNNETDACYVVADKTGASESSVRRAWQQWRDVVEHAEQQLP